MKKLIGKWNKYSIYYNGKENWTVESKDKIENTFESKESFGHWMFHSGFIPSRANKKTFGFKVKK